MASVAASAPLAPGAWLEMVATVELQREALAVSRSAVQAGCPGGGRSAALADSERSAWDPPLDGRQADR
ncbi:MAG: hypothetical protein ACK6AD_03490 [Cyanobacteriota bacterium]